MSPTFIEVCADVRYWYDATVNGAEDTNGTLIPFRKGNSWGAVIRLADGQVMNWPEGMEADIHYKVCDDGEYWLQDESGKRIAKSLAGAKGISTGKSVFSFTKRATCGFQNKAVAYQLPSKVPGTPSGAMADGSHLIRSSSFLVQRIR